jgi:transposase-like protein
MYVLKDANINIAYKTQNTTEHILRPKLSTATENIYNKSDIYQLKCLDCPRKYIGQTGKTFKTRYKEHLQAICNNRSDTGYSCHILRFWTYINDFEKSKKRENS